MHQLVKKKLNLIEITLYAFINREGTGKKHGNKIAYGEMG
jgi:hypothetical protein